MANLASDDWTRVIPSDFTPPYSVFTKPIQKSQQDDRDYRIIQLANGLTATLIHDSKTDKAAASLDVAVGHLYDPDDMPGLAHFCEHLLFMGTEPFPKENEYSEFLAKNNGGSNAYTSTSNTNYYFSVATPALAPALTRFAAFFHSPLFSPSCTSRELNAVDSEHKKNHQSDMWRIFQLNKHLSKPGHVWSKFGSGNRESLSQAGKDLKAKGKLNAISNSSQSLAPSPIPSRISSPAPSISSANSESEADGGPVGRETRRRLVEWWEKEYCASRMRVCVIGKESLDELAKLVSILFSPIPNRGRDALPMITDHPFGSDEKGTLVSVQTIMSFHAVEVSFPLEYQAPYWRHQPANFISHFVGHEGPGSLYSYLKSKGWLVALSAGPQDLARGFAMFKVTVNLTDEGFLNYQEVILSVFKYLSLLRASDFPAFHQHDISSISNIRFRFQEKRRPDDYAVQLTEKMGIYPPELLLAARSVTWDWEAGDDGGEKKVREILGGFQVDQGRAVLMAKGEDLEKIGKSNWKNEPWYGTTYCVEKFDEDFIRKAQSPNDIPELFLPGPNEFIPTNLEVDKREIAEPLKRPHLIRETNLSSLWHKKDDTFWVPKAQVVIDLRSPVVNASARASVLNRLYSDVVVDALAEFSYDADLAGLSYNFADHPTGLYVTLRGYNDKLSALVKHVFEKVKGIVVKPERLAVLKEHLTREWQNFYMGQSYELSDYYLRYLLTQTQWRVDEKLKELPLITPELLQKHISDVLSEINMTILVTGNIYKDEAVRIAEEAEKGLTASPISHSDLQGQSLIIPQGSNFIYKAPLPNPNQANSALSYFLYCGPITDKRLRVTTALLSQILSEPAFNVLRTQEQLGYIVSSSQWVLMGLTQKGIRIVVQSEKPPGYLEARVENFLAGMKSTIEEMKPDEFEEQKAGLERKWREAAKSLAEESNRFIEPIGSGQLDFLRRYVDADLLKSVSKQEVLSLFLSHVDPSSPTRAKISVHMRSQKPQPKRVSSAAAQAFEALVRAASLGIDETALKDALGQDGVPTAADFEKYWRSILEEPAVTKEVANELVARIPALVQQYPVEGEADDSAQNGATVIEDMAAFKSSLKISERVGPLVEWGDLPVSKF